MAEEKSNENKRNVLIAMDESHHSDDALDYYKDHIHRPTDHVIILYVPEYHTVIQSPMVMTDLSIIPDLMRDETERVKNVVDKLGKKLQEHGLGGVVKSIGGKPGETIVKVSKEEDVALIVLGSRGMGSLRRTFMGSVSDYVMHHSHIPVLVCKHPDVHKHHGHHGHGNDEHKKH